MKNENTSSIADATGVSEWWFTRNIIAGLFGAMASLALAVAFDHGAKNQTADLRVASMIKDTLGAKSW